jgi:hypothetical protein
MHCQEVFMIRGTTFGKSVLLAATLAGFLLLPNTAKASEGCRHRIERAETRLDRAIRNHGPDSWQARERRHELHEVRESCHEGRWDR